MSVYRTTGPLVLLCITISITSRGSDKPVCHGGAKVTCHTTGDRNLIMECGDKWATIYCKAMNTSL